MAGTNVGQTLVDVHVTVLTAPTGIARTLVGARSVTTHSIPARITDTLVNVLVAGESSPTNRTAAGEATEQFSARAAVEAGVGGALCHVLLAGYSLPASCAGAGEVGTKVGTVAIDTLSTGTQVNLCASSGCTAGVARKAGTTRHTGGINYTLGGSRTFHRGTGVCCLLTVAPTEARRALAGDAIPSEDTDSSRLARVRA